MLRVFDIDINRIAVLLVPGVIRQPKLLALLQALIAPIRGLYGQFVPARENDIYRLGHNGQVCYLEAALNDAFDPDQRRIYITDGDRYTQRYIYTEAENRPTYLGTLYLHAEGDYMEGSRDFVVVVPGDFREDLYGFQIRALLNFYKLASKRYEIVKL